MMTKTLPSVLILTGFFIVMYVANAWMPLYRDDYLAAVIWGTGDHLQSMQDVFYSLERYYYMHGGRLVSFFVQFAFMLCDKFWFNLANALVFVLMLVLMAMHVRRDFNFAAEPKLLALLGAFAWLGISHFGEIAIWLCGSAVYLWTGLLTAVFLLPYNLKFATSATGGMPSEPAWLTVIMLPLGATAACSVENLTVTTTLLTFAACYYARREKKLSPWMVTGAIGSLCGSIVCLAAPGNYVRIIDDQDRSWLFHFLNQIPSNLEMVMYMLPVILTLVLAWRLLVQDAARKRGLDIPPLADTYSRHPVLLAVLLLSTVSFFTTGFFADTLRDVIVITVLTPLGLTDEVTISHFANTMAGLEEALIYILSVIYVYLAAVKSLGVTKARHKALTAVIPWREIFAAYGELRYGCFCLALAFFNNFVVIGAPSFPGRALFSSSIMFIIGAAVIIRIPAVAEPLLDGAAGKIFRRGGCLVTAFIIVATLTVLHDIWLEDALRVRYIAEQAAAGVQTVRVPPSAIPEQRRILRHIAYDDFDTGMTRDHISVYFGIHTVKLDPSMSLEDLRR